MIFNFWNDARMLGSAFVALLALITLPTTSRAAPPETDQELSQKADGSGSAFRGSYVWFEQSLAHRTFQPGGELTYDPYYSLELGAAPRWWPHDNWYISGRASLSQELTHSSVTTKEDEIWASDTRLRGGTPSLVTIPAAEINVSAGLESVFPTSKSSQARSLLVATGLRLGLSRSFSVLKGLTLSYSGNFQKRFHRYQTRQLETPRIPDCADLASGCDPYAHTGRRNASFRQVHIGSVSFSPIEQLSFSASGGVYVDHLYPAADIEQTAPSALEGSNVRHTNLWVLSTTYSPLGWLDVTGGLRTIHPQLAPDSSYYGPVFNRYSEWTLDFSVDIPSLVKGT